MSEQLNLLNDLELDTLREVVNMGFGQAMGELSEIIKLHIILSVPEITVWSASDAPDLMNNIAEKGGDFSVVEQYYIGKISGLAIFLVPSNSDGMFALISGKPLDPGADTRLVEKDAVLEIGNIVISACVGKIAELLGDNVLYKPPQFLSNKLGNVAQAELFDDSYVILSMKTSFGFNGNEMSGILLLILDLGSIAWIKESLGRIMRSFID